MIKGSKPIAEIKSLIEKVSDTNANINLMVQSVLVRNWLLIIYNL